MSVCCKKVLSEAYKIFRCFMSSPYPPPYVQPVFRPRRAFPVWPFLLIIVVLSGLLIWRSWPTSTPSPNEPIVPRGDLAGDEKSTIELFKQASPSVVHIVAIRSEPRALDFNTEVSRGTGSGFIWNKEGYVVTNYHVVKNATRYLVRLADNSSPLEADLRGKDESRDLAVLKIRNPPEALQPLSLGESHNLQVGQKVFAIGNPFGLDQTLTTGVVSGLGRDVKTGRDIGGGEQILRGLIQTDAAINPGNSGGPLLDSAGRLIGVNTAILSPSGASAGIGFALPVDEVRQIVPILIKHGRVIRPSLGIRPVPEPFARKILDHLGVEGGVIFSNTYPNSPTRQEGMQVTRRTNFEEILVGDIILSINGQRVRSFTELQDVLGNYQVNDVVTVEFLRGQKRMQVDMALAGEAS